MNFLKRNSIAMLLLSVGLIATFSNVWSKYSAVDTNNFLHILSSFSTVLLSCYMLFGSHTKKGGIVYSGLVLVAILAMIIYLIISGNFDITLAISIGLIYSALLFGGIRSIIRFKI